MRIDIDRGLTRFQVRVLWAIRAQGPCRVTELRRCFRARGDALRLAVWVLRRGGWVARLRDGDGRPCYDCTAAGRMVLRRD